MNTNTPSPNPVRYPRKHLIAVSVCSLVMVVVFAFLPSVDATATKTVRLPAQQAIIPAIDAESPQPEPAATVENALADPFDGQSMQWQAQTVRSGDTLSHIFKRVGLSSQDVYQVMQSGKDAELLKKIHPGQSVEFAIQDGTLHALRFVISQTDSLLVERKDGELHASLETKPLIPFTSYAEGTISSSLFLAAQKSGLSEGLTMELASIFGWDIDFVLDIREGDSFQVIYQDLLLDGEKVRDGNILAARFTNQGKTYTAIRYETSDRGASYFSADGDSMRKAFLRSPIDFARISSHFNLNRKHPVLHTIRAHKGTDYAAGRGTPIKATGDGKVIFAGRKGGYGNVVILQHGNTYRTLYAHMNNFARGVRSGTRVRQGQVIGYVGSTGLATGPHLHYEFYVNGAVRNPVTVKLPVANPIASRDKANFLTLAKKMQGQLSTYAAAMSSENVASIQ